MTNLIACFLVILLNPGKSETSNRGLLIDSQYTIFVFELIFFLTSLKSKISTNFTEIPNLGSTFLNKA